MFSKRLAGMVPEARKYVAASVALQWVALAANIALMLLMGDVYKRQAPSSCA